jgi:CheY-like chemotaxis protein
VLVAEDNEVNVQILRLLLNRLGIGAARYVSDGREALDALQSDHFDLVLMDCLMPEVDGYEATRRLRQRGDDTWVIAMTANAMPGDREACLAAGMDDYVAKPLSLASLREALLRWAGRRHDQPRT